HGQRGPPTMSRLARLSTVARGAVVAAAAVSVLATAAGTAAAASAGRHPTQRAVPLGVRYTGTAPAPMGVQFHGMWSLYSDSQRAYVLDKLQAAGVNSVRLDVSWAMLQPTSAASYDAWGIG